MIGQPPPNALLTNLTCVKDVDNQIVDLFRVHYWLTWDVWPTWNAQRTPLIRPNALPNALLTKCIIDQMQCWLIWDTCRQKCVVNRHWPRRCIGRNALPTILLNHIDLANNACGLCVAYQTTESMPTLVMMKKKTLQQTCMQIDHGNDAKKNLVDNMWTDLAMMWWEKTF